MEINEEEFEDVVRRIQKAESLSGIQEAKGRLIKEYEATDRLSYPGGLSQLIIDYDQHRSERADQLWSGEIGILGFIEDAYPNQLIHQGGGEDVLIFRQDYSLYARERLRPIDHSYLQDMKRYITRAGEATEGVQPQQSTETSQETGDAILDLILHEREMPPSLLQAVLEEPHYELLRELDSSRPRIRRED